MALILASGLPGYLFFFLHLLPWSAAAVAVWVAIAALLMRLGRSDSPEPMPVAAWGCLSLPLIAASAAAPFAERWPEAIASLTFWGPPALLAAIAFPMGLRAWRAGHRIRGALIIPLTYQLQLMFCGGLFALARLFSGGSPI
ncbi:hypothetical protein N0B44_07540 [Roseibacterium beibuensis]|uniref:hypothetical protein n=1 Tax=[Roseibacterium] beibuensis TaxID=1193142 RepID=UPI00217EDDE3|nr:hypothetical protein [Roseibacterium beibuensis]MCS6622757.1 hypothetical protein [Roseibacterium beibuensis]